MFTTLKPAPPDAIFGLNETFRADPREDKINLVVGVYQDENGHTPVMRSVRSAERRLAERGDTKRYLPISGAPAYGDHVQRLILGGVKDTARTAQTPGGTGALRVAGDLVAQTFGPTTIWVPSPTWGNHNKIFTAAGHTIKSYPYYNAERGGLDEPAMLDTLKAVGPNDVVLLHGCCHNPTGFDPSDEAWTQIGDIAAKAGWLPLFDLAYQGFGSGLDQDVQHVRRFAEQLPEVLVASSFSKNFGLYSERAGALSIFAQSASRAETVFTHIKGAIRANYSNPPRHAEALVVTVLDDDALRADWEGELAEMRHRITDLRAALVAQLASAPRDFSFLNTQRGMFGYTGLSPEEAAAVKDDHGIYMLRSGRINVAGLNKNNIGRVAHAIQSVL